MKRRELFWMIVPCLLLVGAGAYFSWRQAHDNAPFQWRVVNISSQPLEPADVAHNRVAKWHVQFTAQGRLPSSKTGRIFDHTEILVKNVRLTSHLNGRKQPLNWPDDAYWQWQSSSRWGERPEAQLTIYVPRFKSVPGREIWFTAEIAPGHHFAQGGVIALGESGKMQTISLRVDAPESKV